MQFKFEQLANQILNEGTESEDRSFKKKQLEHELKDEDETQPYKIRVTWKGGGKSYLKAGGSDVVYKGTAGYHRAEAKAKSLKDNPKVDKADVVAV